MLVYGARVVEQRKIEREKTDRGEGRRTRERSVMATREKKEREEQ